MLYSKDIAILDIKKLEGENRWTALRVYLLEKKTFYLRENNKILFKDDNALLSVGYRFKGKIYKKGKWLIDPKAGYIYLKIPHTEIDGFFEKTYYSFKVVCHKKKYCLFLFNINKQYKEPKNFDEEFGTDKYLHMSP